MNVMDSRSINNDILNKYPVTNRDYEYISNSLTLYGMILHEYCRFMGWDTTKVALSKLEWDNHFNQTMLNCNNWYRDVSCYFMRKVVNRLYSNERCLLDPWKRRFIIYNYEVIGSSDNGILYSGGYVIKNQGNDVICSVNITSVEGNPIYCLDLYGYE